MRDFTDDLRDVRRRLDEASEYLKIADEPRPADRARDRRSAAPTCGTTPSGPSRSTPTTPTSRTTSTCTTPCRSSSTTPRCCTSWPARWTTSRRSRRSRQPSPRSPSSSTCSSCAACSPASTTTGRCIVQINAKDGGVDAQDWSEMLLRMYARWAERKGFDFELNYDHRKAPRRASCRPSSRSPAATRTD